MLVAVVAGAGIAQAALNSAPKPAPKALDRAVLDALNAPPVQGVTARIEFTNNLLPSGSLPRDTASPTLTGATGRLWLANDGRLRLELQSTQRRRADRLRRQARSCSTTPPPRRAFTGALPAGREARRPRSEPATLAGVQAGLAKLGQLWSLSGAQPGTTAGRPSYTVRIAPKDDGGLLGAAELAWDAARGVPLRAAVYAQGTQDPVLELEATDIAYGPIEASRSTRPPPAGAKVTEINPPTGVDAQGKPAHVDGVTAVQKRLDFQLSAPDRARRAAAQSVRLVQVRRRERARSAPTARASARSSSSSARPSRARSRCRRRPRRDHAPAGQHRRRHGHELATALGTLVSFESGGVSYLVAGSVPPVAAENAARGLR